tara:strand:- start:1168 stop:2001 length:834 start_codon:yes stop_codon:yes gene_type:complete
MKIKHNKKRNTAFVYESLIREATVAIIKKEINKKNKIVKIIREHFAPDSLLKRDLDCYRSLYADQNLDKEISEKILFETKMQRKFIDPKGVFDEQTALINTVNKEISSSVFSNFVPNYKTLATISQLFSDKISPKNRVLLENKIILNMGLREEQTKDTQQIDKTVYKMFVEKFNTKYEPELLEEQKELLNYYIGSFSDNALSLKVFLNEEITRLKTKLQEAKEGKEISSDAQMFEGTSAIINKLNSFAEKEMSDEVLLTIMKTQSLVKEIYSDGDSS